MKSKKFWQCLKCEVSKETLDVAESAFIEAGAIGLKINDGEQPDTLMNSSQKIFLEAYFDDEPFLLNKVDSFFDKFFFNTDFIKPRLAVEKVLEEDWQGNFVRSYGPFNIDNIYIIPSFAKPSFLAPDHAIIIDMDPENAFGTGKHETTELCLKSLNEFVIDFDKKALKGLKALDIGTGSGILAIFMAKSGIEHIFATDIDEEAIITAKKNVEKNGVEVECYLVSFNHSYQKESYDVIVANILSDVLIEMSLLIKEALKSGGCLILSGILNTQSHEVIKKYESFGFELKGQKSKADWCALTFFKP